MPKVKPSKKIVEVVLPKGSKIKGHQRRVDEFDRVCLEMQNRDLKPKLLLYFEVPWHLRYTLRVGKSKRSFTGQSLEKFSYMLPLTGRKIVQSILAEYQHEAATLREKCHPNYANWQFVLAWTFALLNLALIVLKLIPAPIRKWVGLK